MFKIARITNLLLGLAIIFSTGCRKINRDVFSTSNATVMQVKYACGAACDALGFIIVTDSKDSFTPVSLPLEFRIHNLTVKIRYKNTGKLPKTFTAPPFEQIEVLQISR